MSKKKQDLLQFAEILFYENGFHGVGLKRIVNEAGVALMTMYNHFDSKEELIIEVLTSREERYFSFLKADIENLNGEDTSSIASRLAQSHVNWLASHAANGCMFLRAKEEYSFENEGIVEQVIAHKKSFISFLQEHGFTLRQSTQLALLFEGSTALAEVIELQTVADDLYDLINMMFTK